MSDRNLPGDDWDDNLGDADDGALHDPLLRRALAHAPDHAATPDVALRQSIRVLAHEAVAPSLPAGPVGAERPWWQRLLGIGGGAGSRMPWNAAFATVLVGVLVTVMWQRQPVPGAEPDAPLQERHAAPVPAQRPTPVAPETAPAPASPPPAGTAPSAQAPAPSSVLDAALAEARANTEAAKRALDARDRERERHAREAAVDRAASLAAEKAVERAQQALAREQAKRQAEQQLPPPTQWPPAMPAAPSAPAPNAGGAAGALRAAPPAAAAAPVPPAPAAAATGPAADATPTFNALSQWTQLRVTRGGDSRVVPRAEAPELGALVGSAALAGVGPQPLTGAVDWRIALERNGEVLGVLELAGGQVRWREKGLPAGTGAPGAGALSSLRQALEATR
ncbi:hypothetical protein [Variovorax sp. ZT4R33]|uniref:hypothetical protein n=1 Tax=Variovorax sp. ZT4R33 TaxID=3443743 RepID=UPI003F4702BF